MATYVEGNIPWNKGLSGNRVCKRKDGYSITPAKNHPMVWTCGYVYSHRLIAEKALGKILPSHVPVHHHDETQLVICQDTTYHKLLHRRTRALRICGHANWLRCVFCKEYDAPEKMLTYIEKANNCIRSYHRSCGNQDQRKRRLRVREERLNGFICNLS